MIGTLGTVWELHTESHRFASPQELWNSLGLVPYLLDEDDERSAAEQFADKYQGGWDVMPGFTLFDGRDLKYPGDPIMYPIATCMFRNEVVLVYDGSWVCIRQPDMTFEVARMD